MIKIIIRWQHWRRVPPWQLPASPLVDLHFFFEESWTALGNWLRFQLPQQAQPPQSAPLHPLIIILAFGIVSQGSKTIVLFACIALRASLADTEQTWKIIVALSIRRKKTDPNRYRKQGLTRKSISAGKKSKYLQHHKQTEQATRSARNGWL